MGPHGVAEPVASCLEVAPGGVEEEWAERLLEVDDVGPALGERHGGEPPASRWRHAGVAVQSLARIRHIAHSYGVALILAQQCYCVGAAATII